MNVLTKARFALHVALTCSFLAGCATRPPEPVIRTVTVDRPVAVSCLPPTVRDPPETPDTDERIRASADAADLLQLLAAGRILKNQWIKEAAAAIRGCR